MLITLQELVAQAVGLKTKATSASIQLLQARSNMRRAEETLCRCQRALDHAVRNVERSDTNFTESKRLAGRLLIDCRSLLRISPFDSVELLEAVLDEPPCVLYGHLKQSCTIPKVSITSAATRSTTAASRSSSRPCERPGNQGPISLRDEWISCSNSTPFSAGKTRLGRVSSEIQRLKVSLSEMARTLPLTAVPDSVKDQRRTAISAALRCTNDLISQWQMHDSLRPAVIKLVCLRELDGCGPIVQVSKRWLCADARRRPVPSILLVRWSERRMLTTVGQARPQQRMRLPVYVILV